MEGTQKRGENVAIAGLGGKERLVVSPSDGLKEGTRVAVEGTRPPAR